MSSSQNWSIRLANILESLTDPALDPDVRSMLEALAQDIENISKKQLSDEQGGAQPE